MARAELEAFWRGLDLSDAEAARDALIEFVPTLVREYGDLATAVAADWYEEVRAAQVAGRFSATAAPGVEAAQVVGSTRFAAGRLFAGDPAEALSIISGAVQRYVSYSARETVRRNVASDPARPRYARVPKGATTCAFCLMLASRGFVYRSSKTAGEMDHYHDDCDCMPVVEFDRAQHHIEGYDPDALYADYQEARKVAGSGDPRAILAALRQEQGIR
ncbi:hypothetical protein EDD28_2401 [Salana multivorans]|uniref:Uncharacterized protein n=2 Tax=Salana multivorans TaxID=120377 RepID=A0A3N2DDE1_9MICO|nr:hypothetical protein EDD28_2401 [Salana multivorans]